MKSTIASPAAAPPVRERGHARVCVCVNVSVCVNVRCAGLSACKGVSGLGIRDWVLGCRAPRCAA